jgi:spore coat polysaccharide biosynthesis predicted glycosyltransferase SpsG
LGLPSLVMTIAANQARIADELAAAGVAIHLGGLRDNRMRPERIGEAAALLFGDPGRLAGMSKAAARLVDGRGVERVARALHSKVVA